MSLLKFGARIEGIIFDLDGTLYRFNRDNAACFWRAAAYAARCAGVPEDEDTLFDQIQACGHTHGLVDDWIRSYGMDFPTFHVAYHTAIDLARTFCPFPGLAEELDRIRVPKVILTHASRSAASRMVGYLGLQRHFPNGRIITLEDTKFQWKDRSSLPFHDAARLLNVSYSSILVLEDTSRNLVVPDRLGMITSLIHHGTPLDPVPDHIHFQHDSPVEALRTHFPQGSSKIVPFRRSVA